MSKEKVLIQVKDNNYIQLAYIYQLLKNNSSHNKNVNYLNFKAIIDSDFDTQYQLPSDCVISRNKPQYSGNTVSHFAVEFFNEFNDICLDYLIQHDIDFTIKNDNGYTPLLLALMKGNCIDRILRYYFRKNIFKNFYCKNGLSLFHAACSTSHVDIVECYLRAGVSINQHVKNDSPSFAGYTPLHFAMEYCQSKIIVMLLNNGANLNSKDVNRMTPLHLLVKTLKQRKTLEIDTEMRKFLINAICNNTFNLPDEVGFSCTHLSSILGAFTFQKENLDIGALLNLDSPICPGFTPLHFAALFHFETVMSLLESGADLLVKDINGTTPFDLCLLKFNLDDIIQILLNEKRHQLSELKFINGKVVLEALQAMKTHKEFKDYLKSEFTNLYTFIHFESVLWPGCSLFHLAVMLNSDVYTVLTSRPCLNMLDVNGMSPLHVAFRMMKEKVVLIILTTHYCSLSNSIDRDNLSDLHIACAVNNSEAINHLLKYSLSNLNLPTLCDFHWNFPKGNNLVIKTGSTPLHIAVYTSCIMNCNLVDILLNHGANPNVADANGVTPYAIAFKYKQKIIINQMLKSDIKFGRHNEHQKLGLTRLHVACIIRDLAMIKSELESGADVNKCINFDSPMWPGDTALHILCQDFFNLKKKTVQQMLAYGADPNLQNASNSTPVHLGRGKFLQFAQQSLKNDFYCKNPVNNEGLSHFHICCKADIMFAVENFLKSGIDVNTPVDMFADLEAGYTPLHYAVRAQNLKLIEQLLTYRADPEAKAVDGSTPILLAESLKIDIKLNPVKVQRFSTVNIQSANRNKDIELEKILQSNPVDEISLNLLLDKGASIKCSTLIAETPGQQKFIHGVIRKLSSPSFERLICSVRDLNYIDDKGQNVIHYVCIGEFFDSLSYKFFKAVRTLIDSGGELNFRNNKGKTPLHLTTSLGRIEMAKLLLSLGADVNVKDNDGKTPYDYIPSNSDDLKCVYYTHRLKEAGLNVGKLNNLYNKDFNKLPRVVLADIEKLNYELKRRIASTLSATYFLSEKFIEDYQDIPTPRRQLIYLFRNACDLQQYFPYIHHMIIFQFNRARSKFRRNRLLVSAANGLEVLTGLDGQEILMEILSYLDIDSLMNLIRAVNKKLEFVKFRVDYY